MHLPRCCSFMYLYFLPEEEFSEFAGLTKITCLIFTAQIATEQLFLTSGSWFQHTVEVKHIWSVLLSLINVNPNSCFHYPLHTQEEKDFLLRITPTCPRVMLVSNKSLCNTFILPVIRPHKNTLIFTRPLCENCSYIIIFFFSYF